MFHNAAKKMSFLKKALKKVNGKSKLVKDVHGMS